ncbi:Cullin-2 [Chytridiales sp. JEL 0842]|nr:Cullin-2 [Chytridiales sp. JEL 0842]
MSLRPKRIDFTATFEQFKHELLNLYHHRGHKTFMDPFHLVYDMCTASPRPFDDHLFDAISDFLSQEVVAICENILSHDDIVSSYAFEWERYRTASEYADKICEYLNRLLEKKKNPFKRTLPEGKYRKQRIVSLAYAIWRDKVWFFIKHSHSNRLLFQLLELVRKDRDGQVISQESVRKTIFSLVEMNAHNDQPLDLYIDEFERYYLDQTRSYYAGESNTYISSTDFSSYMKRTSSRLEEEARRMERFCDPTSKEKAIKDCEDQWILVHIKRFNAEFHSMIAQEKLKDMSSAYQLLGRVPNGFKTVLETLEEWIFSVGKGLVQKNLPSVAKDPKIYIEALIELHQKYTSLCQTVLNGDPLFIAAVDKAFRNILNNATENSATQSPEIISRYCDLLLKKGAKPLIAESDLEDKLVKVWSLADVKVNFADKKYELNVSMHQLAVLLAFNDTLSISNKSLAELTKSSEAEMGRVVKSLIDAKIIIADSTNLGDDTQLSLNLNFSSKRTKIKINTSLQVETQQEVDATRKSIDEDRRLFLQAAIVRIMKSRKECGHTKLIQEAINMSKARFLPSVPMIKKCIEQLIEKGYLGRSTGGNDGYQYIA